MKCYSKNIGLLYSAVAALIAGLSFYYFVTNDQITLGEVVNKTIGDFLFVLFIVPAFTVIIIYTWDYYANESLLILYQSRYNWLYYCMITIIRRSLIFSCSLVLPIKLLFIVFQFKQLKPIHFIYTSLCLIEYTLFFLILSIVIMFIIELTKSNVLSMAITIFIVYFPDILSWQLQRADIIGIPDFLCCGFLFLEDRYSWRIHLSICMGLLVLFILFAGVFYKYIKSIDIIWRG